MAHRDWELLIKLYKLKSITKTAEELFMTQPALTKRLKQIEEEFGIRIALRSPQGLVFTPKGECLVEYAQRMLEEYQELTDSLAEHGERIFGTLHIGTCSSLARFLLPDLLGQYRRAYPEVEFEVTSEFSFKVSQLVNTQKVRIGFIRGEHASGCKKHWIRRQQGYVVSTERIRLEDLPHLPRVDFYSDQTATNMIESWWHENFQAPPRIAMKVSSGSTCREMVRNGLGYAIFLSDDFIRDMPEFYRIPMTQADGGPVFRNDWMIYREESLQLELVRSFVEFAEKYFKKNDWKETRDETKDCDDPCHI